MQSPQSSRADAVRVLADRYAAARGPLLPILHAVQHEFGCIERGDIMTIADALNLSIADVHGVVSFYADLRTTPPPPHTIAVCRGEACQAVGGQALHTEAATVFAARDDVEVTEVFCLGNCALGPSATVDGRLRGLADLAWLERECAGWVR
ncbi:MAG: NAD(P)H-dependent oxidoreductase subunit E [Candidatus Phosphoribacter sp.]|nr:NAD(P)H-dependent oxidoreductase subunit E [Actinomycetales bacterium]